MRWKRRTPVPGARLQRLGDVSLFIAGFFARSFARKLIDIDYHIAMGQRLQLLADTMQRSMSGRCVAGSMLNWRRNFKDWSTR